MAQVYVCDNCGEKVNDKSAVVISAATGKMAQQDGPSAAMLRAMGIAVPNKEMPELKQGVFCGVKCAMTFLMLLETVEA